MEGERQELLSKVLRYVLDCILTIYLVLWYDWALFNCWLQLVCILECHWDETSCLNGNIEKEIFVEKPQYIREALEKIGTKEESDIQWK